MRLLLRLLSLPQIIVSLLLEVYTPRSFNADIDRCITTADLYGTGIPDIFVEILIIAEDHRNKWHPGIDAIAMIRALWVRITRGRIEGASTIEQQFVRVVSNRFERNLVRKLREQILALMVARRISKHKIASAYLSIAFYGSGFVGKNGLNKQFGSDLSIVPFEQVLKMIAQLKFPRPLSPNLKWQRKIESRYAILLNRIERENKKPLSGNATSGVH